jgi:hypothetical protein
MEYEVQLVDPVFSSLKAKLLVVFSGLLTWKSSSIVARHQGTL